LPYLLPGLTGLVAPSANAFHIMNVHVPADRYRFGRRSDHFPVLSHMAAGLDRPNRDFMPERYRVQRFDLLYFFAEAVLHCLSSLNVPKRRRDIILCVYDKRVRSRLNGSRQ
jgi:hypothetical protein